ncbi:hypothetical protein HHI36_002561 [Cryptolaemus montrouzieri]|uniref:Uncharacterized protein n=1 Tax=Cryptolaemus montrouzieri TaxID=559131 RepID=A0ABD2PBR8_9CUCU
MTGQKRLVVLLSDLKHSLLPGEELYYGRLCFCDLCEHGEHTISNSIGISKKKMIKKRISNVGSSRHSREKNLLEKMVIIKNYFRLKGKNSEMPSK